MAAHLRRCPANIVQCNSRNVRPEMNGICQQVFRREELAGHQQFSHLDICEPTKQYCPLAYQGCKFTIDKKTPQVPNGEVIFCKDTNSFNISRKDREQISDKDTEGEEAFIVPRHNFRKHGVDGCFQSTVTVRCTPKSHFYHFPLHYYI
ncbi:Hypothetical predicted protein [Mytilus galloprovincialis]|uniref:TRAF-type domain-containing protein n=1 Tax=Mytilus galloprovincialis TaxID=29158 RepID=A0A8B6FR25_MYTGA|nr:Hypothetical predicted protein [Mytilus galloprovincialis]